MDENAKESLETPIVILFSICRGLVPFPVTGGTSVTYATTGIILVEVEDRIENGSWPDDDKLFEIFFFREKLEFRRNVCNAIRGSSCSSNSLLVTSFSREAKLRRDEQIFLGE